MRTSLLLTLAALGLAAPLAARAAPLPALAPPQPAATAITQVQYYGPPPAWREREAWRLERERAWRRHHDWEWRHAHHWER